MNVLRYRILYTFVRTLCKIDKHNIEYIYECTYSALIMIRVREIISVRTPNFFHLLTTVNYHHHQHLHHQLHHHQQDPVLLHRPSHYHC